MKCRFNLIKSKLKLNNYETLLVSNIESKIVVLIVYILIKNGAHNYIFYET